MRRTLALLVGAVLFGGLLLTGAATADHTDQDRSLNETDRPATPSNASQTTGEVGVCMIGVDSACNGEQWDGDGETEVDDTGEGNLRPVDDTGERTLRSGDDTGEAGICLVGAGGPCNDEGAENRTTRSDEKTIHEPGRDDAGGHRIGVEPGNSTDDHEAGICLVGADTACNSDRWADAPVDLSADSPFGRTLRSLVSLF